MTVNNIDQFCKNFRKEVTIAISYMGFPKFKELGE